MFNLGIFNHYIDILLHLNIKRGAYKYFHRNVFVCGWFLKSIIELYGFDKVLFLFIFGIGFSLT